MFSVLKNVVTILITKVVNTKKMLRGLSNANIFVVVIEDNK